jgi:hypothetical protein
VYSVDDAIVFADGGKAASFYAQLPIYQGFYGVPRDKFFYSPTTEPETVRFGGLAESERRGLDILLSQLAAKDDTETSVSAD